MDARDTDATMMDLMQITKRAFVSTALALSTFLAVADKNDPVPYGTSREIIDIAVKAIQLVLIDSGMEAEEFSEIQRGLMDEWETLFKLEGKTLYDGPR